MRSPGAAAGALAALALGAAHAAPVPAVPQSSPSPAVSAPDSSVPAEPDGEKRFDSLLPRLDRAIDAAQADSTFDPVVVIDAQETAGVAEELLEEGDADTALKLLEEAIALLPAPPPE